MLSLSARARHAFLLAALCLAACGGGTGGQGNNPTTSDSLSPTPTALAYTIDSAPTGADLTRSVSIDTSGAMTWTAAADVPWLSVTPTNGSGGSLTASLVPGQLNSMYNGTYQGTITITPAAGVAGAIAVTLTVDRAQVNYVAPYVAVAGTSAEVIVRGRNFGQVSVQNVRFGAINATAFTVVSDTEIRATHPALAPGNYTVQLQNNFGVERSLATLVAVAAPVYVTEALDYPNATAKQIQSLVYDAERRRLAVGVRYGAMPQTSEIFYFSHSGSAWAAPTSVSVPGLRDLALSLDGSEWLAVADAAVSQLDAGTFAPGPTTAAPFASSYYFKAVAVASDGNAAIASGMNGGGYSSAYWYDTRDPALIANSSHFSGNLGASGDGSRLIIASNSTSPDPMVYYYQASTGTIIASGLVLNTSTVALDRTGARLLLNHTRVYDDNFAYTGELPATTLASVLAPNGTRAYALDSCGAVRAFDLTAAPVGGFYPETGSAALADVPGDGARLAISPDGGTLFLAGDARVVVLPVP